MVVGQGAERFDPRSGGRRVLSENERRLARQIESGDQVARGRLIEQHADLVAGIARRYVRSGVPMSDMIQEGTVGLIQAVDRFDWRQGTPFAAYASLWIHQAIRRALPKHRYAVRIPSSVMRSMLRLGYLSDQLSQRLHRAPTMQEIGEELPQLAMAIEEMQQLPLDMLPLDPLSGGEDSGPADFLAADDGKSPESLILLEETGRQLRELLGLLGERDQDILVRRLGLFGRPEQTFAEIADELGLSRQRIKQIEERSLRQLRDHIRSQSDLVEMWASHLALGAG